VLAVDVLYADVLGVSGERHTKKALVPIERQMEQGKKMNVSGGSIECQTTPVASSSYTASTTTTTAAAAAAASVQLLLQWPAD